MKIEPWWLPRWLNPGLRSLRVSEQGLESLGRDGSSSAPLALEQITGAFTRSGFIATEVVIEQGPDGMVDRPTRYTLRFPGFRTARASDFVDVVSRLAAEARLRQLGNAVDAALEGWDRPHGKGQYMSLPLSQEWHRIHSPVCTQVQELLKRNPPESEIRRRSAQLVAIWRAGESARLSRNIEWISEQRSRHANLFANAMSYALNDEQISAILLDEHRSLVVAGAGTGKTTTVVAKTRWILAQRLAAPHQIRILAFNRKAANEIEARLGGSAGNESIASTFHSLGLSLVGQGRGRKPRLTSLSEDKRLLQKFIRSCLDDALSAPATFEKVANFLFFFRYPEPNPVPARGSHQELSFSESHEIRTLTGVKVRSNSEAAIANWLTLNGIGWEYEPRYQLDTATVRYGQYRPDFLLPDYGIYIEHWSCDADGALPPTWSEIDKQEYLDGMAWKRALHERRGTQLIETFSSRFIWRDVVKPLEARLLELGVVPQPMSDEVRRALMVEDSTISPVVTLLERFLALFRESALSLSDLYKLARGRMDERGKAFIDLFEVIHERYVEHLREEDAIDFSDMIRDAAVLVRQGAAQLPIEYLIVDEFQDISRGRAELIKAILSSNPRCRLVAVGDDWQSIYRFAGSDIRLMLDFEKEFGAAIRSDLQHTQRFGDKLIEATSRFIQTNPLQLKKKLIASRKDAAPAIEILSMTSARPEAPTSEWSARVSETAMLVRDRGQEAGYPRSDLPREELSTTEVLERLLREISVQRESASVLVLGRYNFLLRDVENQIEVPSNVSLSYSTVHRAKGLEADFVVILAVVSRPFGFPSEIEDDPILDLILPSSADFPNAEERRLFYVAMTRARFKVFVVTRPETRSSFVEELEKASYAHLVIGSGTSTRGIKCPECGGETLTLHQGKRGPSLSCAHDRCQGRAQGCPRCRTDGLVRGKTKHECYFCSYALESCPNCTSGYLKHVPAGVSRATGKAYEAFDACSTNRLPSYKCFTRKCACS